MTDYVTATLGGREFKFRFCLRGQRIAKRNGIDVHGIMEANGGTGFDDMERTLTFLLVAALPYDESLTLDDLDMASIGEIKRAFVLVLQHAMAGEDVGKQVPDLASITM